MTKEITQEEKIDYIYHTLKKNQKKALLESIFKWLFRLAILWYLYYFLTVGLPVLLGSMLPSIPKGSWSGTILDTIDSDTLNSLKEKFLHNIIQ